MSLKNILNFQKIIRNTNTNSSNLFDGQNGAKCWQFFKINHIAKKHAFSILEAEVHDVILTFAMRQCHKRWILARWWGNLGVQILYTSTMDTSTKIVTFKGGKPFISLPPCGGWKHKPRLKASSNFLLSLNVSIKYEKYAHFLEIQESFSQCGNFKIFPHSDFTWNRFWRT